MYVAPSGGGNCKRSRLTGEWRKSMEVIKVHSFIHSFIFSCIFHEKSAQLILEVATVCNNAVFCCTSLHPDLRVISPSVLEVELVMSPSPPRTVGRTTTGWAAGATLAASHCVCVCVCVLVCVCVCLCDTERGK